MLAIDFETYLINSKEPSPKPVCISWYDGKETGLVVGFHNIMKFLEKALQEPLIVAHNMKFELGVIYRWYPELISKIDEGLENDQFICTKINEELLDATRSTKVTVDEEKSGKKKGYSLSELVRVYFKEDISGSKKREDAWRLRYSELDEVPLEQWPQEAVDYAISDSIWAYKLAEVQLVGLAGRDITSSVSAEHYLTVMSNYGMLVDQSRVEILEAEIKSKMKLPIEFLISKKMMRVEEESVKDNTTALNKLIVKNVDKDNIKINSRNSISLTKAALKKYIEVAKTEESKETLSKYLEFTFTNKGCEEAKKYLLDKGLLVVKPLKYVKSAANFQKYLEDNVPGDILRRTAKGFIQTSKEKLEEYDNGEDEVIKSFVRIAQYEKVITSFTSRLKEADPYIRTDYSGVKRTCRTSSSTTKSYPSVNIQQMPRSVDDVTYTVRNCFIPRPGYKICSIDYSGLELASAGHMLFRFYGEGRLRDTLNKGDKPMDLHSYLASRIMSMQTGAKISYEEFLSRKKEKEFKSLRQIFVFFFYLSL